MQGCEVDDEGGEVFGPITSVFERIFFFFFFCHEVVLNISQGLALGKREGTVLKNQGDQNPVCLFSTEQNTKCLFSIRLYKSIFGAAVVCLTHLKVACLQRTVYHIEQKQSFQISQNQPDVVQKNWRYRFSSRPQSRTVQQMNKTHF